MQGRGAGVTGQAQAFRHYPVRRGGESHEWRHAVVE